MARLGIPANIPVVRAAFRQPRQALNPLQLTFRAPITVELRRTEAGAASFAPYWQVPVFLEGRPMLPRRALIPLMRKVTALFEQQLTSWQAFDDQGRPQPRIDEEIQRQLAEYGRRHPEQRGLHVA